MSTEDLTDEDDDLLVSGKYFQGNENILRTNAEFKWKPEMVDELKLCIKSILHFAENYFFIIHNDRGKEKIELYKYQKRLLKAYKANRFNVVLSSRQSGKTTTITIYALWLVCFFSDKRVTIVANKESTAKSIFASIRLAYEELPIYLKPGVKSWRKDGFNLLNGGTITISTTSSAGPRGTTSNLLIIDEAAHCPPDLMRELWKSAIPIISSSKKSQIVVISTPNGTDNKFYDLYLQSQKPGSNWNLERVDWWDVPGRDEEWKKDNIELLGSVEDFEQEYGNSFESKGKTVIDVDHLNFLKSQCSEPVLSLEDGFYKIYKLPEEHHQYIIGVDVGEGVGRTNSVIQILDVTDLKYINQAAVWATNHLSPYHFGTKLASVLEDWGRPPVLIEANNNGQQVLDVLYRVYNYENIVSYSQDKLSGGVSKRMGILSNTNIRYNGITNFRYWANSLKVLKINDLDTLLELDNFIRKPDFTFSKQKDNDLDDRIFGLIWALFILNPNIVEQYFRVIDINDQGKPIAIKTLNPNNDLLKNSPLGSGSFSKAIMNNYNHPHSSIMVGNGSASQDVMARDSFELLKWLQFDGKSETSSKKEIPPEDEYRPVVFF